MHRGGDVYLRVALDLNLVYFWIRFKQVHIYSIA